MDALKKTWSQYQAIYQKLTGSQRLTLTLAVAGVLAALLYWGFGKSASAHLAVYHGKNFTADEMTNAQTVLREAGLNEFKQDGGRLLVPRGQVDRYEAALLAGGGLPDDWGSELEKQVEKQGFFPSDRQSRVRREIALGKDLRRILRAIPEVADAKVIWARAERPRFSSRAGKVTATVNIKPKPGRELSPQLIHSLRDSVSKMISGLKPEDVTIFNLKTGESYSKSEESPFDGRYIQWIKQHTKIYKDKIEKQLSFIPDVRVSVEVKLENLKAHMQRTLTHDQKSGLTSERIKETKRDSSEDPQRSGPSVQSNQGGVINASVGQRRKSTFSDKDNQSVTQPGFTATFKEFIAAAPKEVYVSVAVPDSYFKKIADSQGGGGNGGTGGNAAAGRQQVLDDIKKMVTQAIGELPDSNKVAVLAYKPTEREDPDFETPFTETAMVMLNRWGGPVGLGLFALLALWMVKRSMPTLPEIDTDPLPIAPAPVAEEETEKEEEEPPPPSPRDELQAIVRDNPDVTAAVLSDWLAAAE